MPAKVLLTVDSALKSYLEVVEYMKISILTCFVGLIGLCVQSIAVANIMTVRENLERTGNPPSESDRNTIDAFWQRTLDTMLISEESAEVVAYRRQIQRARGTDPTSPYTTAYIQIGKDHLQAAFRAVQREEDPKHRTLMRRNLMILTAQLKSPHLAEFGLDRLDDQDEVVRYWAVKTVAGRAIAMQLADQAGDNSALTESILDALRQRVENESDIQILRVIVNFAAMVNHDKARQILLATAERRKNAYMNWQVDHERFDADLLNIMGQILIEQEPSEARSMMARRFAELLSLVFQRYMAEPSPLTTTQRDALVGIIAKIENQVLNQVMGQQTPFVRIIQRGGAGLEREVEAFFGSDAGAGHLASRLEFNYGQTADGRPIHTPPQLPAPPER